MSRVVMTTVFMALLASGQSARAAFTVNQTGDTLDIKGPVMNDGDFVVLWGTGPGTMHMWDSGAYLGAFTSVKHVNVDVWGPHSVTVGMLGVQIQGDTMIATGGGSDRILFVSNEIGGLVAIDTGDGDDMVNAQHNSLQSDLYVGTAEGDDNGGLYDCEIAGDATFQTGAGLDEVIVGYDAAPGTAANTIKGDLILDAGEHGGNVEIACNSIGGDAILHSQPHGLGAYVRQNYVRGRLSLTSGEGGGWVRVFANEVDSDVGITMSPGSNHIVYLFVKHRNRIRGNLSIDVGDCGNNVVDVIKNEVGCDTAITLGVCYLAWDLCVDTNVFRGNVTLDTTSWVLADLYQNRVRGDLNVSTGNEADEISLARNICDGDVTIDAGGGDDDLALGYQWAPGTATSTFNGNLSVNGGAGLDTLYHDLLNSYAFPPSSQGFENVIPF